VVRWGAFQMLRPDLAAAGRGLFYQFGVGLGFLGTLRRDGGPRVHPICPLLTGDGLYAFLAPSFKRDDLRRDPRYALHSFPSPQNEDAFYVTGTARPVGDDSAVAGLRVQFLAERKWDSAPPEAARDQLFEFLITSDIHCVTRWSRFDNRWGGSPSQKSFAGRAFGRRPSR